MAEYIEREKLGADFELCNKQNPRWTPQRVASLIARANAADVVEVVHGRWVGLEYDGYADGLPVYDLWECSECGNEVRGEDVPDTHPWCNGCGARMDGET